VYVRDPPKDDDTLKPSITPAPPIIPTIPPIIQPPAVTTPTVPTTTVTTPTVPTTTVTTPTVPTTTVTLTTTVITTPVTPTPTPETTISTTPEPPDTTTITIPPKTQSTRPTTTTPPMTHCPASGTDTFGTRPDFTLQPRISNISVPSICNDKSHFLPYFTFYANSPKNETKPYWNYDTTIGSCWYYCSNGYKQQYLKDELRDDCGNFPFTPDATLPPPQKKLVIVNQFPSSPDPLAKQWQCCCYDYAYYSDTSYTGLKFEDNMCNMKNEHEASATCELYADKGGCVTVGNGDRYCADDTTINWM